MQTDAPILKELVLAGGGHSHALLLRMWGMHPIPGIRLTVISDHAHAPYSGMLPGLIEGVYTFDEAHIDIARLCIFAGARFIRGRVIGLDLAGKRVRVADRPPIAYDLLSLNVGSVPPTEPVPGADTYAIQVKPVSALLTALDSLLEQPKPPRSITVVGGGAGGVELLMALMHRFNATFRDARPPTTYRLVHSEAQLLETHHHRVRRTVAAELRRRGVELVLEDRVVEVLQNGLKLQSGSLVEADAVFWATGAAAPQWPAAAGLSVDARGFVAVTETLQSVSHPEVFAAGDVASMKAHPRPKSGVFAVRQAKPLYHNLRAVLLGEPLRAYRPQSQFLSLIGTADGRAIASRGPFSWHSRTMWRWKEHIDRKFMRRFEDLPSMEILRPNAAAPRTAMTGELEDVIRNHQFRCSGCGAKVGQGVLERALRRAIEEAPGSEPSEHVLVGLEERDDAAVLSVPPGSYLLQSVDYFPALLSDPYLFARIAVVHAASDLHAMGARISSAQLTAVLPPASSKAQEETLYQIVSGVLTALAQEGATLVGGHSAEGKELALGLTVNGWSPKDAVLTKNGMRAGDRLVLTKPLGVGCLFAAEMRLRARARWLDQAIASMLASNGPAGTIFRSHGAHALTDITGFGLAGHLLEMLTASRCDARLDVQCIPALPGALEVLAQGIASSLQQENRRIADAIQHTRSGPTDPYFELLFDPQTAGGLLASVPAAEAEACLAALKAQGYAASAVIGEVTAQANEHPRIVLA
ncbi:MAG: selenide, water dikinase SelD [Bdellovibrionales bacterium]|nr:selenide, water dikinase SelD [Bdellovibrionales bacterium]